MAPGWRRTARTSSRTGRRRPPRCGGRATEGVEIWTAIPEAPTAREAIERFLLNTAASFTRPGKPRGCLVVLGALQAAGASARVSGELRDRRAQNISTLRARLERAIADGELPAGLDCLAVATFYVTVQQGMSIQALDGASRDTLAAIARSAMAGWNDLTRAAAPGQRRPSPRRPRRGAPR